MLSIGEFLVTTTRPKQRWLVFLIRHTRPGMFYYVCFRNGVRRNFYPSSYRK